MDRKDQKTFLRMAVAALLVANLGILAGCGGGGGGGVAPVPPLKSGDVVWTQTSTPSPIDNESYGLAMDGNNLYVVGYDSADFPFPGDNQWRIEKRGLSDGALVTSFGSPTGAVTSNPSLTTINSSDVAYAVAVDSSYLYVVGYDSLKGDDDQEWRIEKRSLSTGGLVTSFGTGTGGGYESENINVGSGLDDQAYAVAVDSSPTGTLYVVGFETTVLNGMEWRIEARDKATGTLATSVTSSLSFADDYANAIAIDPAEGYMYVVGTDSSSGDHGWRIEKRALAAPLSLETTTFGGATGYVYEDVSAGANDEPLALALDANYMYIAGYEYDAGSTLLRWRIEKRHRSDGALETTTFGGGTGSVVSSPTPTPTTSVAQAIAIDANYIYVAGYDNTASGFPEWRIEKRDLITGDLVTSFGTGGVVVNDFGTPALKDSIRAITVDANYVYVAGYESLTPFGLPSSRWRISKIVK